MGYKDIIVWPTALLMATHAPAAEYCKDINKCQKEHKVDITQMSAITSSSLSLGITIYSVYQPFSGTSSSSASVIDFNNPISLSRLLNS